MIRTTTLKRLVFLFFFGSILIGCSKYETVLIQEEDSKKDNQPNEKVFDLHKMEDLPEIKLTVPLKDWNTLLDNYDRNSKNKEKVVCNFEFKLNGEIVTKDSIGVRLRGNTSRVRPEGSPGVEHQTTDTDWNHCHFGLDFNKFIKGQKFNGLKALNLKWFKSDPSYARNIYCYDLFERFGVWTAPQASYCKLTIHVEGDTDPAYYGVYAMIEAIDEDFIENRQEHWGAGLGNLWKAGYPATFEPTSSIGVEVVTLDGNGDQGYSYDLKTNKEEIAQAKAELNDFINNLNNKTGSDFENWIESKMDVSLFLKTYAVNVIVGMWDDYWINGNNYYFYIATDGKAYFVPYDYDNTLGTSVGINGLSDAGTQDPLRWGTTSQNRRPLINKILAIAKYETEYKAYLKQLIDSNKDLFEYNKSVQRLTAWRTLIKDDVPNATGEDMIITDQPASWSNARNYRLFTGDDRGKNSPSDANFFKSKAKSIYW